MGTITDIEATDTGGGASNNVVQTVTLTTEDDGAPRLACQGETTAEIDFDATALRVVVRQVSLLILFFFTPARNPASSVLPHMSRDSGSFASKPLVQFLLLHRLPRYRGKP